MTTLTRLFTAHVLVVALVGCTDRVVEQPSPRPSLVGRPSVTLPHAPATPGPSRSSSPGPHTPAATAACPVSLPNVTESPQDRYVSTTGGYQNAERTIFTELWPGGKVIFSPRGPGQKFADGSLEMKWPWYRTFAGDLVITGRHVDTTGSPLPTLHLGEGRGFHPSLLRFPSAGCWEVTATVGADRLTFVTQVVKVSFDPPWPGWLPDGLTLTDRDVTGVPMAIGHIFGGVTGNGEVRINTAHGIQERHDNPVPAAAQQSIVVHGQSGVCTHGTWDTDHHWRTDVDVGQVAWVAEDVRYQIMQTGLALRCAELLRIAESLCFDPTAPCEPPPTDRESGHSGRQQSL